MKVKQKGAKLKLILYIVIGVIVLAMLAISMVAAIEEQPPAIIIFIVIVAIAVIAALYVRVKQLTLSLDEHVIHVGIAPLKYRDIIEVTDEDTHILISWQKIKHKLYLEDADKEDFLAELKEKIEQAKEAEKKEPEEDNEENETKQI